VLHLIGVHVHYAFQIVHFLAYGETLLQFRMKDRVPNTQKADKALVNKTLYQKFRSLQRIYLSLGSAGDLIVILVNFFCASFKTDNLLLFSFLTVHSVQHN